MGREVVDTKQVDPLSPKEENLCFVYSPPE